MYETQTSFHIRLHLVIILGHIYPRKENTSSIIPKGVKTRLIHVVQRSPSNEKCEVHNLKITKKLEVKIRQK